MKFSDDTTYIGYWKNDKANGKGKLMHNCKIFNPKVLSITLPKSGSLKNAIKLSNPHHAELKIASIIFKYPSPLLKAKINPNIGR